MFVDQPHDRLCDLSSAYLRRLYLVGVIGIFVADESQIDQWNARQKRLPDYHVVENRKRGDRYFLYERLRDSRVIDRANRDQFLQAYSIFDFDVQESPA